jgi:hypothetical protein
MGETGIEIRAVMTGGTKLQGKFLHLVHLDGLNVAGLEMVINLDGKERREPLYESHFLPCAPGDHDLVIAWESPVGRKLIHGMSERKLKVHVDAGQVALVEYTPGDQLGNAFSKVALAGSRPA